MVFLMNTAAMVAIVGSNLLAMTLGMMVLGSSIRHRTSPHVTKSAAGVAHLITDRRRLLRLVEHSLHPWIYYTYGIENQSISSQAASEREGRHLN